MGQRQVNRSRSLLSDPIIPTLFKLSWPNVLVMLAQSSTGLIETWWISHLGTDALAGMAVVFPVVILMQMMSGGAMGGGISSAIARALGRRDEATANALVFHAVILNFCIGAFFSICVLTFGGPLYSALGGTGASLDAALAYSNVVFLGMPLLWTMNALASVIRGTGNMIVPAIGICGGALLLVVVSPLLIFGTSITPALHVAGGGVALVLYYVAGLGFFSWFILSGRNHVHLAIGAIRKSLLWEILRVGAVAAITSIQTNLTIGITTSIIGAWFGSAAIAGYGTGARIEYLLVPLVFGIGGTLVAMVGMNIGANQYQRAKSSAFIGATAAFVICEIIGIAAAIYPEHWLRLFDTNEEMIRVGSTYLRIVGPFYGFFGFGMAMYFSSQGAGRLKWPLIAGFLRLFIATAGGWAALWFFQSEVALFTAQAISLVIYGCTVVIAIRRGAWE